MPPLRAEASTVSIPPRERAVAKRRAKAIKHGQSLGTERSGRRGIQRKARLPEPTLASTRNRRARELAFIRRADGIHVKQVVRRPTTQAPVRKVPYLPGQEDIPHSDSDNDSDSESDTTESTVLDPSPVDSLAIEMDADEDVPETEVLDYDAEGEDDEDVMMDSMDPAAHVQNEASMHVTVGAACANNADPGHPPKAAGSHQWSTAPAGPAPDLSGISAEELHALFGGLDRFAEEAAFTDNSMFPVWEGTNGQRHHGSPADYNYDSCWQHTGSQSSEVTGSDAPQGSGKAFAMHQLHATVEDMQPPAMPPGQLNNVGTSTSIATAASIPHNPFPDLSTLEFTTAAHNSSSSLLDSWLSPQSSLLNPGACTRGLVQRTRAAIGSRGTTSHSTLAPANATPSCANSLPHLVLNPVGTEHRADSDDDGPSYEGNQSHPSTPVELEDTDIGLREGSPPRVRMTQAQTRAARYLTVKVVPRPIAAGRYRIPTILDLRTNARKALKLARCHRGRGRRSGSSAQPLRVGVRHGEMTRDQRTIMPLMQYHVLKNLVFVNPWPEDREAILRDAQHFAETSAGISGPEVMTEGFLDTVWSRLSGLRGGSLSKIEFKVEQDFEVSASNKAALLQLMSDDLFLYPTTDRHPSQYFRVGALGSALEILMFQSTKNIGLVFMEDLCTPDDAIRCLDWHQNLRDRTAHAGVPPGAIALAATMMYWALEKLYVGSNISFDEKHFRPVWERYFRALVKLPHLGQLRRDLLDQLKDYYVNHWPTPDLEDDEDGDAPAPAW